MKAKIETLKALIKNVEETNDEVNKHFLTYIDEIKDATHLSDITVSKKELLLSLTTGIPLDSAACYFCHNYTCEKCPYASHHIACTEPDSNYEKITFYRNAFIITLSTYYNKSKEIPEEEVTKEVKDKLLKNITASKQRYDNMVKSYITTLTGKNLTVEALMQAKKFLLTQYLLSLPLGINNCCYCLTHIYTGFAKGENCARCNYGKVYGICTNENSTYSKITESQKELLNVLQNYYNGEKYKEIKV